MMFKKQFFLLVSAFSLVTSLGWSKISAQNINREIKKAGATWVAKDNWLTNLPPEQIRRMMGVQLESGEGAQFSVVEGRSRGNNPTVMDWRNHNGQNWISPMLNQANCGSCVAFAAVGVMESQYRISSAFPLFNLRLSTQNLFACGRGLCDRGWFPDSAARHLQTVGVPDESCMPYVSGATGKDVACNMSCADSKKRILKIAAYKKPTSWTKDLDALRAALQKGPLVTTLTVYSDFMSYSSGVYKHVTGKPEGGHAVSIVGYDDTLRAFIIRNSWGEEWGEGGFGYISYDDVSGIGDATWLYEIPAMNGAVSVESPVDNSYFTGTIPFQATSTYKNTTSLDMSITDEAGRAVWSGACTAMSNSTCNQDIQIESFKDGKYQVQVTAVDAKGLAQGTSTYQTFYVVNNSPTLNLEFTAKDLDKPLKGRIVFDIKTSSTSVPMSSLIFNYASADGKVGKKTANVVLDEMTLGWRTTVLPNGTYEIWMEGRVDANNSQASVVTPKRMVTIKN